MFYEKFLSEIRICLCFGVWYPWSDIGVVKRDTRLPNATPLVGVSNEWNFMNERFIHIVHWELGLESAFVSRRFATYLYHSNFPPIFPEKHIKKVTFIL